jgi:hypothetical protein
MKVIVHLSLSLSIIMSSASTPLALDHHMWSVGDKLFEAQATTDVPLRKIEPTGKKVYFGISIDQKEDGTPYIYMHVACIDEEGCRWGHHLHAKVDQLDEHLSDIGNKLLQINATMEEKDKIGFDVNLAMKSITASIRSIQERQPSAPVEETKPVSSFVPVRCIMGDPNLPVIRGPAPDGTPEVDHHIWYKEAYGPNQTVKVLARTDENKNNKALDLAFHITTVDIQGDWWECVFYDKVNALDAFSVVLESKLREINTAFILAGLIPFKVQMAKRCLLEGIQAVFDSPPTITIIRPDPEGIKVDTSGMMILPLVERIPKPSSIVVNRAPKYDNASMPIPSRVGLDADVDHHVWYTERQGTQQTVHIWERVDTKKDLNLNLAIHIITLNQEGDTWEHTLYQKLGDLDVFRVVLETKLEDINSAFVSNGLVPFDTRMATSALYGAIKIVLDQKEQSLPVPTAIHWSDVTPEEIRIPEPSQPRILPHSEGKVAYADPIDPLCSS